jgi:hypothetical protein
MSESSVPYHRESRKAREKRAATIPGFRVSAELPFLLKKEPEPWDNGDTMRITVIILLVALALVGC